MASIVIQPGGRRFDCEGKQSILEAALSSSVPVEYGCSMGTCGLCQARLIEGDIEKIKPHDFVIGQAGKMQGQFLMCAYTAASPTVVIEAGEATGDADIPRQTIEAKIKGLERFNEDIAVLSVWTPRSARLRYVTGQSVRLTLEDGAGADLPLASCPCEDRKLEFHLRRADDAFSTAIFVGSPVGNPVRVEGPWGQWPGDDIQGPVLCIAHDIGIAALKGWIELQLADDNRYPIDLIWSASQADFYLARLFKSWSDAFDPFNYALVEAVDTGAISKVVRSKLADYPREVLQDLKVLVSGPDKLSLTVRELLAGKGLTDDWRVWTHRLTGQTDPSPG